VKKRQGSSVSVEVDCNGYTIKDSGKRQEFSTGMQRDSGDKIQYDLVPQFIIDRMANHLTAGAKKYSSRNWEKACTIEELERFIASAERHFNAWASGETDEDHVSALIFNLVGTEMVIAKLNKEELLMGPLENITKRRVK
jgi:hypothetical protein